MNQHPARARIAVRSGASRSLETLGTGAWNRARRQHEACEGSALRWMMLLACAASLAGCASVPRSVSQSLEIEVVTPLGAPVSGARCQLSQGSAQWEVVPPARAAVISASEDLLVRCEADAGGARGEVRLQPKVRASERGRSALVGAGIGGLVGTALGAIQDSSGGGNIATQGVGWALGALGGLGWGAVIGAVVGGPRYEYPVKVLVTLVPLVPEAAKP